MTLRDKLEEAEYRSGMMMQTFEALLKKKIAPTVGMSLTLRDWGHEICVAIDAIERTALRQRKIKRRGMK